MVDADTFLTALYVVVDDFCKAGLPPEPRPGPAPALSRSEVLTLGIFGQWHGFGSERGFYRYARRHLRPAFPALPAREQFNRHLRRHGAALLACLLHLAHLLRAGQAPYEVLDSAAVPTRDAKRRGAGWLPGLADIGWSNRLGWFEGLRLLLAVTPTGVVTGFGLGPASPKDQPLAETSFALRRQPIADGPGPALPPAAPTSRTAASRARTSTGAGCTPTGRRCSVRPGAAARTSGPRRCGAGSRASARSSRRSSPGSATPSGSSTSGRTAWTVFRHAWRPSWRCTTPASGSTTSSADRL